MLVSVFTFTLYSPVDPLSSSYGALTIQKGGKFDRFLLDLPGG